MKKTLPNIFIICLLLLLWQCSSDKDPNYDNLSPAEQQVLRGERVYKQYCRSCHGSDGKMGLSGAKDLSQSELNLEQRKLIIANGRNTMTPFQNILSDEEIQAVAKYTFTLSGKDE